jgi:hypothetical protein
MRNKYVVIIFVMVGWFFLIMPIVLQNCEILTQMLICSTKLSAENETPQIANVLLTEVFLSVIVVALACFLFCLLMFVLRT